MFVSRPRSILVCHIAITACLLVGTPMDIRGQLANLVYDLPEPFPREQGGALLFSDGRSAFLRSGRDGVLWSTDTTSIGTIAVLDGVDSVVAFGESGLWVRRGDDLWWTNGLGGSVGEHVRLGPIEASLQGVVTIGDRVFIRPNSGIAGLFVATPTAFERVTTDDSTFEAPYAASATHYFYAARNGPFAGPVWGSDGTALGTAAVLPPSSTRQIVATDRFGYILRRVEDRVELWRSDGTAEGTIDLTAQLEAVDAEVDTQNYATPLSAYGSRVCLRFATDSTTELMCLRDDETDFERVTDYQGSGLEVDPYVQPTEGGVYFAVRDQNDVHTLRYQADGSTTAELFALCPESCETFPAQTKSLDGEKLVLLARGRFYDRLWATDSSSAGSLLLTKDCFDCMIADRSNTVYYQDYDNDGLFRFDFQTGVQRIDSQSSDFHRYLFDDQVIVTDEFLLWSSDAYTNPRFLRLADGATGELAGLRTGFNYDRRLVPGPTGDQLLLYSYNSDYSALLTDADGIPARFLPATVGDCFGTRYRMGVHLLSVCDNSLTSTNLQTGATAGFTVSGSTRREAFTVASGRFVFTDGRQVYSTDAALSDVVEVLPALSRRVRLAPKDGRVVAALEDDSNMVRFADTDGTVIGTRVLDPPDDLSLDLDRWGVTGEWVVVNSRTGNRPYRVHRQTGSIEALPQMIEGFEYDGRLPVAHGSTVFLFYRGSDPSVLRRYELDDSGGFQPDTVGYPGLRTLRTGVRVLRLSNALLIADDDLLIAMTSDGRLEEISIDQRDDIAFFDDRVFFAHQADGRGIELWSYDAERGLHLVHDLWPGPPSSIPQHLVANGNRLYFIADDGIHGREVWSLDLDEEGCEPHPNVLCLQDQRFKVESAWWSFSDTRGRGFSREITSDTGGFYFFDDDNIETLVKVLDARAINQHYWTFLASLTNVRFELTVSDGITGRAIRYGNASGNFASLGDTRSLNELDEASNRSLREMPTSHVTIAQEVQSSDLSPCVADETHLCLQGNRFEVQIQYLDFAGGSGFGTPVPLTADTGAFWFFDEANLEVAVKLLNGVDLNQRYWVFYGALSNVAFTLRVRDTETGLVRIYENDLGEFASVGDTDAFAAGHTPAVN